MRKLALLALTLAYSMPAWAAPAIDKAGADALKPRLAATLKNIEATMKEYGYTLKQQGELMVEPAGTYYAITTPALFLDMGTTTRTIGMLAINAVPTDNPDIIKVALAIPTPIIDKTQQGIEAGKLTIGTHSLNGLWHLGASAFVNLNATYKNINFADNINGTNMSVPDALVQIDLKDAGENRWSGPTLFKATNISFKDKNTSYTIASAQMRSDVEKLDIFAKKKFNEASEAAAASKTPASLRQIIGSTMTGIADATSSKLLVSDITIKGEGTDGASRSGKIASVVFDTSLRGLRTSKTDASWNFGLNNFTPADSASTKFAPTQLNFKGSATGIPVTDMLKSDKLDKTKVASMLGDGASLTLEALTLDAPAYGLDANGVFKAAEAAKTGKLHLSLRGLNDLMAWVSGPNSPKLNGMSMIPPAFIGILSMVQMSGKQGTDAQGRQVFTYDLEMGADGKTTLNGADLSTMMQMMGGGAAGNGAAGTTPATPH